MKKSRSSRSSRSPRPSAPSVFKPFKSVVTAPRSIASQSINGVPRFDDLNAQRLLQTVIEQQSVVAALAENYEQLMAHLAETSLKLLFTMRFFKMQKKGSLIGPDGKPVMEPITLEDLYRDSRDRFLAELEAERQRSLAEFDVEHERYVASKAPL